MYSTTSLEEVEVTPEAEDKCRLVVAMLEESVSRRIADKIGRKYTISGLSPAASER